MLIGNLTRDPELRYTPNGAAVCSFGLATNRSWSTGEGGERKEETEFHRIVAWNKLAELCGQLLTKGRKVYIEGRLQTRSWEGQEGEKRQATEVVAEDMVLLDSRKMGSGEGSESPHVDAEAPEEVSQEKPDAEEKDSKKKDKKGKKEDGAEEAPSDEIDIDDIPF